MNVIENLPAAFDADLMITLFYLANDKIHDVVPKQSTATIG